MEAFKQMLTQTDDEYLIGLSNKGTVKRAYKDLDQEPPAVTWGETEAEVTLKEAVCTIRMPLGESTCTCPSRSVCRHLITAILYLKSSQADTEVLENTKAFYCAGWKGGCKFTLWKDCLKPYGVELDGAFVKKLLKAGKTERIPVALPQTGEKGTAVFLLNKEKGGMPEMMDFMREEP